MVIVSNRISLDWIKNLRFATLGLVGHEKLDRWVGRNETFNHAGNMIAAILAGLAGDFIARKAIFFLVAAMAVGRIISVRMILKREIDHELARGDGEEGEQKDKEKHQQCYEGILRLLSDRQILFFTVGFLILAAIVVVALAERRAVNLVNTQSLPATLRTSWRM